MRRIGGVVLALVVVGLILVVVRFVAGGPEDNWICEKGQWVKHGNPSSPPPNQECVDIQLVGNDSDEHGCLASAGYTWCPNKQKCLREWEEPCSQEAAFTLLQHIKLTSNLAFSGIQPGEFTIPPSQGGWVMNGRVMDLEGGGQAEAETVGRYIEERGLAKAETVENYAVYRSNELVCMVDWSSGLRLVCAEVGK